MLFKQESFSQFFNTRDEINTLFELLSEEEIDRLIDENVVFVRSCAPSSSVVLSNMVINGKLTLINFDHSYYKKLLPEEFVGVLLHEIGHVFNPQLRGMEAEYAADNFAKTKKYAKWIISGLTKGLENNWLGFETNSCQLRIEKLNDVTAD
mgnify:CR=1 FL=1